MPPEQEEVVEQKPKKQPPPVETRAEEPESSVDEMTTNYESTFFKMILTLVGLILLIFITFWTIRRLSQGRFRQMNAGRSIKIVERRPLSPKTVLYLVEVGNKKVVIAESQLEVKTITDIENTIT